MRYPKNDDYCAGWDWAGDALTYMSAEEIDDSAETVAADLCDLNHSSAEMAYEGIMDRLKAAEKPVHNGRFWA
jgi:hypothetical protein